MEEKREAPEEQKKAEQPAPSGQEEAVAEVDRLKDQLLRLQADFENARRRWRNEQAHVQERANADILRELLEIHDDFQRALAAQAGRQEESLLKGVEMISRRLQDFLKSYGIVPIEAQGKLFDPALHEAVAHEVTELVPDGAILSELRKGYTMNGRVLRTAVVKVASRPETKTEKSKEES